MPGVQADSTPNRSGIPSGIDTAATEDAPSVLGPGASTAGTNAPAAAIATAASTTATDGKLPSPQVTKAARPQARPT